MPISNAADDPLFFFQKQVRIAFFRCVGLQQTTVGYTFLQSLSQMPFAVVFGKHIANSVDSVQTAPFGAV